MLRTPARKLGATVVALISLSTTGLMIFGGDVASSASSDHIGGENAPTTLILTPHGGGATTTITLSGYDFSVSPSGSQSSGAGAGKVTFSSLVVTTSPGSQTAAMFADVSSGTTFDQAELIVPGPRGTNRLDVTFTLVILNKLEESSVAGGTETLTLEYGALQIAPSS
jgi:hypothetical protein